MSRDLLIFKTPDQKTASTLATALYSLLHMAPDPRLKRLRLLAAVGAQAAAFAEETPLGKVSVAWQFGGRRHLFGPQWHAQAGNGFEEQAGVRVARLVKNLRRAAQLDDLPQVHHGHPVRHVPYHRDVMGNQDVGQIARPLQLGQRKPE